MFQSKKQINRANAIIAIAVVIVLTLFVNILSTQLFGRFDVTENKDYSISGTTKDVLRNLDDVVNVKAYFTEELPGYLLVKNQDVRDILAEFGAISGGNVIVTFLDPSKDEQIAQEARGIGIPTLQFNVVEKDKYQVMNGYLGIALFYGDEREIIPIVQDTQSLEYDLTAAISKVIREEVPSVAFLSGRGAFSREADMTFLDKELQRQYRVRDFDITSGESIPQGVDTLIIPGTKEELTEREKYVIDQFLMRGGDILVMAEGVKINPIDLTVEKINTGIDALLAQWGVRLNKNLALDASNELAAFRTDQVQFFSPYPFWIKVPKSGFNPESGIVNKLESLVITWGSTVEVLEEKLTDKTEKTDLVRTTANAWIQDGDWQLNPKLIPAPKEGTARSYVLGTMLSGHFESLFSKDEIPPKIVIDDKGAKSKEPVLSDERDKFLAQTDEGRVIVIGDADFPLDINLNRFASNAVFFQNLVDALTSGEALINIRSKAVTDRPLRDLSDSAKNSVRWLNILLIPVLFALYGLARFAKRRKSKLLV